MENCLETGVEARKEWAAPELKKIDIAQITAASVGLTDDGQGGGS